MLQERAESGVDYRSRFVAGSYGATLFLADGQTKFDPAVMLHAPPPDSVNNEVPVVTVLSPGWSIALTDRLM